MAKLSKFTSYFISESGRKFSLIASTCTGIALFAGNLLPQTIFLDKYREVFQCYRGGIERELNEKVLKRVQIAIEKLDLREFEKSLIKPFAVYGFDDFYAGSTKYKGGAIIGIPTNYALNSPQDINPQEIQFRHNMIDWGSESGKLLKEALVLTENEQIFGIAKSILQTDTHKILLDSIFPTVAFITCYTTASGLNRKYNFFARPLGLRLVLYAIIGLFGIGLWAFSKDFTQMYFDTETDKKLCELGPEFIEAGVRYYDKILKKNLAIRLLLGDDTYTAKGNLNYLFRQKSLPLTVRKSYFEMRMEEIKTQIEEKPLTEVQS